MWTAAGENASEGVVVGFLWGEGINGLRQGMEPGCETTGMQVKSALTRGQMNIHPDSLYFPWTTAPPLNGEATVVCRSGGCVLVVRETGIATKQGCIGS